MRALAVPLAALALLLPLLPGSAAAPPPAAAVVGDRAAPDTADHRTPQRAAPRLRIDVVTRGLDIPWDVRPIGGGRLLVTQRDRARLTLVRPNGSKRNIGFPRRKVWRSGETGLMGLAVDPRFAANRRIYTCQGWKLGGGGKDIRVIAWRLNPALTRARKVRVLLKGLPTRSGRHGGCRLLIARNGALLVGTGDAAVGRNPQSLRSFGGKVLRLDRRSGRPWPGNPWADGRGKRRYILTYGHRNVQGLAQRRDGTIWSVEHGSHRDDEVNLLRRRGNYGWHPVPGYNESVPMTDQSLPGRQIGARWRSGTPTIATSGADFAPGKGWGRYAGTLAVACLAGERLMFVRFNKAGRLRWARAPRRLRNHGRLRGVTRVGRSLLVTTSNGGGSDRILRIRPRPR